MSAGDDPGAREAEAHKAQGHVMGCHLQPFPGHPGGSSDARPDVDPAASENNHGRHGRLKSQTGLPFRVFRGSCFSVLGLLALAFVLHLTSVWPDTERARAGWRAASNVSPKARNTVRAQRPETSQAARLPSWILSTRSMRAAWAGWWVTRARLTPVVFCRSKRSVVRASAFFSSSAPVGSSARMSFG